jgi:hypothetical protein
MNQPTSSKFSQSILIMAVAQLPLPKTAYFKFEDIAFVFIR